MVLGKDTKVDFLVFLRFFSMLPFHGGARRNFLKGAEKWLFENFMGQLKFRTHVVSKLNQASS